MVYRVIWRVGSGEALDFWEGRLGEVGVTSERGDGSLHFRDPEGLELELAVVETDDAPLVARHPDIPAELALQGFDSVRVYTDDPGRSRALPRDGHGLPAGVRERLRVARRARGARVTSTT